MDGDTVTIESHFVFYGDEANEELAIKIVDEITSMFNAAEGEAYVNQTWCRVMFKITFEVTTEKNAFNQLQSNSDPKKIFVRIESSKPEGQGISTNRSEMNLCDNSGFFVTSDNLGNSTTAAHEYGHSLGLLHPASDQRGKGNPGIMAARGTLVDEPWRYDNWQQSNYLGVDPAKRTVTQTDIDLIFKSIRFNQDGFADIGTSRNYFYTKEGKVISSGSDTVT